MNALKHTDTQAPQNKPEADKLDSRQALLEVAKPIFANRGYDAATVKELAEAANVNVSLISYYFGGKEGLYRACILNFAQSRMEAMDRILCEPKSQDEFRLRLRMFAEEMIDVHLREPDLCTIIHRDIDMGQPVATEIFKDVFFQLFLRLENFLRHAEKIKLIGKPRRLEITTSLVFGSLIEFLKAEKKRLLLGRDSISDKKYREDFIETWLDLLEFGLRPRPATTDRSKA